MTIAKSSKQILTLIGNDKLDLVKVAGSAYWYFEYNDNSTGAYHESIVSIQYLNGMSLEEWTEEGRECIAIALNDAEFNGVPNGHQADGSFRIKITSAKL